MLTRGSFLELAAGAMFACEQTTAPAEPSPSPTPNPKYGCRRNPGLPYDKPLGIKLETLDGPGFDLEAHRGNVVLLNVFATWCGPCRKETPLVVRLAEKYAGRGLYVVGINDREPDDTVRRFRKEFAITYPIAMDRKGILSKNLEGTTDELLPATLLVGPRGYLRCYVPGEMDADELEYRIERALAGSEQYLEPAVVAAPTA
jgi:thiol-disulfide isomerase/thioredoxin